MTIKQAWFSLIADSIMTCERCDAHTWDAEQVLCERCLGESGDDDED